MIRYLVFAVLLAGCSAQYQSARTLPEGKFQVTAAASNVRSTEDGDDHAWTGDVQVRGGLADRLDGGIHLGRTPSFGNESISAVMVDLKKQLTDATSETAFSLALPIGIGWIDEGDDWGEGTYLLAPTILFGQQVSPEVELVVAPKLLVMHPDGGETRTGGGLSLGVRISDTTRSWAMHPEISISKLERTDGLLYSFGFAVAAGN